MKIRTILLQILIPFMIVVVFAGCSLFGMDEPSVLTGDIRSEDQYVMYNGLPYELYVDTDDDPTNGYVKKQSGVFPGSTEDLINLHEFNYRISDVPEGIYYVYLWVDRNEDGFDYLPQQDDGMDMSTIYGDFGDGTFEYPYYYQDGTPPPVPNVEIDGSGYSVADLVIPELPS